jgi:hypothetical protein
MLCATCCTGCRSAEAGTICARSMCLRGRLRSAPIAAQRSIPHIPAVLWPLSPNAIAQYRMSLLVCESSEWISALAPKYWDKYGPPDARTPDPSGKGYPAGSDVGQFGWDVGMTFSSLPQLESKLKTAITENDGNKVERLAIDVHGAPGYIDIDGKIGRELCRYSTTRNLFRREASPYENKDVRGRNLRPV